MTFDEAVTQIQRSKFDNGYGLLRSLTGTNERTAPRTKPLPFNPDPAVNASLHATFTGTGGH